MFLSTIERTENMKKNILFAAIALVPVLACAQTPIIKGDAVAGKVKALAICSGCHGIAGTKTAFPEVYLVPKIGGQNADYLVAALKAYRNGDRNNETMKGLASALKETELVDIAAYYAQK
jgi:cytochrome c553